jgi:hypothetical protein
MGPERIKLHFNTIHRIQFSSPNFNNRFIIPNKIMEKNAPNIYFIMEKIITDLNMFMPKISNP